MNKSLVVGALVASMAIPAVAHATESNVQSVYRTERTVEVVNSDGSVSETHIVTRYYILGVE